jgi:lysophospholipase L1-like esterase
MDRTGRLKAFIHRWLPLGRLIAAIILIVVAGWFLFAPQSSPSVAAVPSISMLPGAAVWNQGVSSLLFGTNDTYEWSTKNVENQPAIQASLRDAGFTLVRTFIPDQATDATIQARISTIQHIGAQCLAVLTNINDLSFNEHVVSFLGDRCQLYEFGNEPDYTGIPAANYLTAWNSTVPLLRRINRSAKFIGPVTSNYLGVDNYLQDFLEGIKVSGVLPDAISFHYYPCYNDSESSCLAKADMYQSAAKEVRSLVKQILGKDLPVGISEWNYDPGNPPPAYGDDASFMTAFSTRAIASMIAGGVAFACQFDAASNSNYGVLDMFNVTNNQAKPQYYALADLIKAYRPTSSTATMPATATVSPKNSDSALLSQGATTICSPNDTGPGEPEALTDGKFGTWGFWQLATDGLPGWCALHLSTRASSVILAWYSDYSFDYTDTTGLAPNDYDISVSANSTNGSDGTWRTVVSVRGNQARAREHLVNFAGMSWIKMTVLAAQPQASQPYVRIDELEVFDAQKLGTNTFLFSGDSITAIAYGRLANALPSFADDMRSCSSQQYPLMIDGGVGGENSSGAAQSIHTWLAIAPDMHYWLLEWGSNDALEGVSPQVFKDNLQKVVTAILAKGDVPVLAHIPYSTYQNRQGLALEIQRLNQVIDEITSANHLIAGPDFYTLLKDHPEYLSSDGLHPNQAGSVAMNALWLTTLSPYLGPSLSQCS